MFKYLRPNSLAFGGVKFNADRCGFAKVSRESATVFVHAANNSVEVQVLHTYDTEQEAEVVERACLVAFGGCKVVSSGIESIANKIKTSVNKPVLSEVKDPILYCAASLAQTWEEAAKGIKVKYEKELN